MSISNLFSPNNYNLFCESITIGGATGPEGMTTAVYYPSSPQVIPTSADTIILFGGHTGEVNLVNIGGSFNNNGDKALFTVTCQEVWNGATGTRHVWFQMSPNVYNLNVRHGWAYSDGTVWSNVASSVSFILANGDFFNVYAYQDSGGNLSLNGPGVDPNVFTNLVITRQEL